MQVKNGIAISNGGHIYDFEDSFVEVLGPGISGHRDNMVVAYAMEGNIKVEMVYLPGKFVVLRHRGARSVQHYWSRAYDTEYMMKSSKYRNMANFCIRAYNTVFKQ